MSRHQDRAWYVLPAPMPARRAGGTVTAGSHSTAIAFAFEGDAVIWLAPDGSVLRSADGWTTNVVRP